MRYTQRWVVTNYPATQYSNTPAPNDVRVPAPTAASHTPNSAMQIYQHAVLSPYNHSSAQNSHVGDEQNNSPPPNDADLYISEPESTHYTPPAPGDCNYKCAQGFFSDSIEEHFEGANENISESAANNEIVHSSDNENESAANNDSAALPNQVGFGGGEEDEEENLPSFRTIYDKTQNNNKFKIAHRNVRIQLTPSTTLLSVSAALDAIIDEERQRDTQQDFLGFTINSDTAGREIQIEFKRRSQVQNEDVSLAFERVVQSNEQFLLGHYVDVEVITVQDMHGKGLEADNYKKISVNNHMIDAHPISDALKFQFGLFAVTYKNLCLLVAINVAIEHHIYMNSAKSTAHQSAWKSARRQNTKNFVEGVQKLYKKCNLDFTNGATFTIIRDVEAALEKYRLVVYDGRTNLSVRYKGYDGPDKKTTLYLYYDAPKRHFNCITKIAAFLGTRMFCKNCEKGVNTERHKCGDGTRCRKCRTFCKTDATDSKNILCSVCNMNHYSTACYNAHIKASMCNERRACPDCGCVYRIIKKNFVHTCNTKFCQNCAAYMPQPHLCYIKPSKQRRDFATRDKIDLITAADLESRQENMHAPGVFEHVVNMAVGQTTCFLCRDKELTKNEECVVCGPRNFTIDDLDGPNDNILGQFLAVCSEKAARKKRADGTYTPLRKNTIIFHYGKGYDNLLIMHHVLDNHLWQVKAFVSTGRKILKIELLCLKNGVTLRIIDFYNFCAKPLKSLPAAFQLPSSSLKGDWPHYFNAKQYYDYNEPCMPDIKFWNVDNMPEKQRHDILQWHCAEDQRLRTTGECFNFKKNLRAYCRMDVTILRQCTNKFRNEFLKMKIDAFSETFTLASLCNLLFRRKFYQPKSIGLIPKNGYRGLQSNEGLLFLLWREHIEGHLIDSAARQKEVFIFGRPCDGVYRWADGTTTIYEYYGDYWHYCPHCFSNGDAEDVNDDNDVVKTTPGIERRIATLHREKFLKEKGFKVVSMWGCEFKKVLAADPELKQRLMAHPLVTKKRLTVRDALKGGRCVYF